MVLYSFYQYHRGRRADIERWVFGMVDTSHTPALGYMQLVDRRDTGTLLPIVRAHTAPGTIVHSDEWAAYAAIGRLIPHVTHDTVNHSREFVAPQTGVHTQHVESYWSRVKKRFKNMKGVHSHQLPSYLDEFMWRERYGKSSEEALENILRDISVQYPV
jgi:transposase-like protein